MIHSFRLQNFKCFEDQTLQFLIDTADTVVEDQQGRSQFSHQGTKAEGLGTAYMLDALAISLRSHERWEKKHLELLATELDDEANLSDTVVDVKHACCKEHVQEHSTWIKDCAEEVATDGATLWKHKDALFPHLQFCASVEQQLRNVQRRSLAFKSILAGLHELEQYCGDWQDGPFNKSGFASKVNSESETALNSHRQEHTFLCPDGQMRLFSWHIYLKLQPWRIYFIYDVETRCLTVGYIHHLPTARHKF